MARDASKRFELDHVLGRHLPAFPPFDHRGMMDTHGLADLERAASGCDDFGYIHAADCGASPRSASSQKVGPVHTRDVPLPHSRGMRKPDKELAKLRADTKGWRLRKARLEKGMSLEALAEAAGFSRSHINKMETEGDGGGREAWVSVAEVLDSSVDYLLGSVPKGIGISSLGSKTSSSDDDIIKEQQKVRLAALWDVLPFAGRYWILRLVEGLVQAMEEDVEANDIANATHRRSQV